MKLSKNQQEVVDLMKDGWSLGLSNGIDPRAWMQQGKLGHGGKAKDVHSATFWALWNKHVIICKERNFPTTEYVLSVNA